jgi:hypothetical protein
MAALMLRSCSVAVIATATALAAAEASAGPLVVIVEDPAGPSLSALPIRVSLQSGADVRVANEAVGDGIVFVARAREILGVQRADLVVWVTPVTDPPGTYVVYAIGAAPDRALIELVRVDAGTAASEIERVIALKIGSLLDSLLIVPTTPVAAAAGVLGVPPEAPRPRSRWRMAPGVLVALGGDVGLAAGVGLGVEHDRGSFGFGVDARWFPAHAIDTAPARVAIDELGASAFARASRRRGRWRLGAELAVAGAFIGAEAIADGRHGARTVFVPRVRIGIAPAVAVGGVELGLGLAYERALIHQRFLVDGVVAIDLGTDRALATLTMSVPVR